MECSSKTLTFKVSRKPPELIAPAHPTPHEFKPLSDVDDQGGLRVHAPFVAIYEGIPSMEGKDPVGIIRLAIAKALVFYYPFAGRLREIAASRKLVVECTAEGVLFIEAEADATVAQFAGLLHPPFPNLDQLLYNVPGSDGIIDCPLILIQVILLLSRMIKLNL